MRFLIEPVQTWNIYQGVCFTIFTVGLLQGLGTIVFFIWGQNSQLSSAQNKSHDNWDWIYINFNKAFTVIFNHFLMRYCWDSGDVSWEQITFANTLLVAFPLLLLSDDLMYYCWHRALHVGPLYKYIHKHHHRSITPFRGADDAVNAHPIEYIVTALFIPSSVAFVSRVALPPHVITVALFTTINALLSHANHTRLNVRWLVGGYELYASRNHDTHHHLGAKGGNYAQLVSSWDHLCGTFVPWTITHQD